MAYYFDTSALVKLVVHEAGTDALREWLGAHDRDPVAADLVRTELFRAVRRSDPELLVRARLVLDGLTLLQVTTSVFEAAGRLDPTTSRTLDAVHLAAALDLGDDLDGLVTYDDRLAHAAAVNGVAVTTPL